MWKPYGTSPFVLLFEIFPSISFERLSVSCVNLLEYPVYMRSHYFIIAHDPPSFCSACVVEVQLHLVIAQPVHYQHQDLRLVRVALQILCQDRAETAVVVVPLYMREQFGLANAIEMNNTRILAVSCVYLRFGRV